MSEIKYNPKIHCCPKWYKDFCKCSSSAFRAAKKNSRDKNVEGTIKILKDNNIKFIESKSKNVVILNPETDNVHLSLKRTNHLFKVRYSGSNKWYTFGKNKLISKFSSN